MVATAVPGLDLATALARMSGHTVLYVRTARAFSQILETVIPDLQALRLPEQKLQALLLLHTLKGNAGTLGAAALAREAARLEALLKGDDQHPSHDGWLDGLSTLTRGTRQLFLQAIALLDVPAALAEPVVAPDNAAALGALYALDALLQTSDMQACAQFAEVRAVLVGVNARLSDELEATLQDLNFEEALVVCRKMVANLSS